MIIFICGLSGAGKTTIGKALYARMKQYMPNLILLDGDEFRSVMGNDLGYGAEDRRISSQRVVGICRLLESQGINVIHPGATIHPEAQKLGREIFKQYCEVLVETSLETLMNRDTKDIYRRALAGELKDVLGIDLKFEPPASPHLVLNNDEDRNNFDDFVDTILEHINEEQPVPIDAIQHENG